MVRSIGVSNFNKAQMQRILNIAKIKPVVNQVLDMLITLISYESRGHLERDGEIKSWDW